MISLIMPCIPITMCSGCRKLSAKYLGLSGASVLEVTRDGKHKEGIGRVADLNDPLDLRACCEKVKDAFGLNACPGLLGSLSGTVKKACHLSGIRKKHESALRWHPARTCWLPVISAIMRGLMRAAQGLAVIDAGHYGIETYF